MSTKVVESKPADEDFYDVFGFADEEAKLAHIGSIWDKVGWERFPKSGVIALVFLVENCQNPFF